MWSLSQPGCQAMRSQRAEELAHAFLADIDALLGHLDGAVARRTGLPPGPIARDRSNSRRCAAGFRSRCSSRKQVARCASSAAACAASPVPAAEARSGRATACRPPSCRDCRSGTARCTRPENLRIPSLRSRSAGCASARRGRAAGAARGAGGGNPACRIRRAEPRVVVELRDLPDAVDLGVLHLVHAFGPGGAAAEAAEVGERAPAPLRGLPAGIQVHHRLDVHVVVEPVVAEPHLTHLHVADIEVEMLADAFLADEHAGGIVRHGIVGEELGEVGPHSLVEVVAVGALQPLDGLHVFRRVDFRFAAARCAGRHRGGFAALPSSLSRCEQRRSDHECPHESRHPDGGPRSGQEQVDRAHRVRGRGSARIEGIRADRPSTCHPACPVPARVRIDASVHAGRQRGAACSSGTGATSPAPRRRQCSVTCPRKRRRSDESSCRSCVLILQARTAAVRRRRTSWCACRCAAGTAVSRWRSRPLRCAAHRRSRGRWTSTRSCSRWP